MRKKYNRQEARRKQFITGNSSSKPGNFKGAPEPSRDLFVYRVDNETTASQIKNHLTDHGFNVRDISCVSNALSKYKSFRLTVSISIQGINLASWLQST